MAARYPIRLAPLPLSATHRSQNANANSLAGGSACRYGPLVLKGQNVPNIVCAPRMIAFQLRLEFWAHCRSERLN